MVHRNEGYNGLKFPLNDHTEIRFGKRYTITVTFLSKTIQSNQTIAPNIRAVEVLTAVTFEAIGAKLSSLSSVKFRDLNKRLCEDWLLGCRILRVNNC